ncbi:MAG TPA: ACT domain-containing protein [Gaiellaceae bacterium]|nr:ACT domain-containing protein [Gaiellaceae bacterium]
MCRRGERRSEKVGGAGQRPRSASIPYDLAIEIKNEPGALARVAAAINDAGVNLAGATCIGTADQVELHILVPHAEAARHALAISHVGVSREREVVVVEVEDRPGVLADLTRKVAQAGIDLDLVYVATRNRLVFGAADLAGLKAVLEPPR